MKQKSTQPEPATKGDIKKLEQATQVMLERLLEKMQEYRSENMTRLDEVMGELQAMREDSEIGTYQIRNLTETTENHEARITKLEHA